jgi:MFS family permease
VGGFLASVSFEWLFLIDGLTTLLAGVSLMIAASRMSHAELHMDTHKEKKEKKSISAAAWKDRRFVYFLIALIPVTFVFFQHMSTMPLYLVQDLHLSEAHYGLLFTINTLLIVLLEVPLNLSTVHWSHRKNLALGTALFAVGFGALAIAHTFWSVVATVVIWTFGEMILFPGSSAYVSHLAPPQRQGEYMGFYSMTFALAFMFAPWVGTQILQQKGGPFLWGVTFILGMISTIMMGGVKATTKEETPPEEETRIEFST